VQPIHLHAGGIGEAAGLGNVEPNGVVGQAATVVAEAKRAQQNPGRDIKSPTVGLQPTVEGLARQRR
jgi:hypothetical protein